MKLLLTSDGITNKSIAKALFDLVGKKPEETTIAMIPTAMNVSPADKKWFAEALYQIGQLDLKLLDIVDISALPKEIWLSRLEAADVLFFNGGNSFHLMHSLKESGLISILPELLKTRVYAGLSAGSTVTAPDLASASKSRKDFYEKNFGYNSEDALNFADFYIKSHLNAPYFPERTKENLLSKAKNFNKPVYALDYNSALKVIDGNIEVISEGEYHIFNQELNAKKS
ncbi:MAG: Type 1 glutamine amidotransferase-like domain-containing protein [Patescibacteria group bacterium]